MALETTLYDSADYLDSPEAIAAYIEAAFEDGEPALITHALGVVARAKGMSQLAREAGVTREALYKALTAEGDPKLSTFIGVLKALGMRLTAKAA
jgi:probable addiction module antidote protein